MARRRLYSAKRRAIMFKGDDIDRWVVFENAGWMCCICKGPVEEALRHPHPMAATLEHLIPLSKGGTHTWDNVGLAHAKCNFDKSDGF
jgi:5-methylcytosine-specific restriction endonuclease McrA